MTFVPWFVAHPDYCRRCSGDGWVLVGGHTIEEASRLTCERCHGTGKEPVEESKNDE